MVIWMFIHILLENNFQFCPSTNIYFGKIGNYESHNVLTPSKDD
jgi:hypothetical protein